MGFSALSDDFKTSIVDHFASVRRSAPFPEPALLTVFGLVSSQITGDKEDEIKPAAAPKAKAKASDKKAEPAAKKAKKK